MPTTTPLLVPPSGNIEARPTLTERPAPGAPATASPERIQLDMKMAGLGDLAVEAVFPAALFFMLWDMYLRDNEKIMRWLRAGKNHRKESGWWTLIAGSCAEGVAMEKGWGHPPADENFMWLYCGDPAVGVVGQGELPPEGITLMYQGKECPPAYTRLEVVDRERLVAAINKKSGRSMVPAHTCVEEEGGRQWLLSRRLLDAMRDPRYFEVQGPAASTPGEPKEFVTALVGTGPHPDMAAYSERPRKDWPSTAQLKDLLTLPFLVVCVGPKDHPDSGRLFRASWSLHEMTLFMAMVPWAKQGYICFKLVMKGLLAPSNKNDGRSRVGSYHLKTVFLRYLEEHPPQPEGSPFQLVLELCQNLKQCLRNENIPHYFLPACNLLEKVDKAERQEALNAVDRVLYDPIAAIIGSPSSPREIFGACCNKAHLLRCFRAVSDKPAYETAREKLQRLLQRLDEHRARKWLKEDGRRAELVELTGFLQHISV